ncbi:MAG TPA: NADH-quinone oxidoreductase subunit N [Anaerolineales bacterium]|nr:NADH-quinone oxidoreductase subunit N [Anaerolineales bacterium]
MGVIDMTMILALLPEILLVVLTGFVLVFDLVWRDPAAKRNLGWLTAGGAFLILAVSWLAARPGTAPLEVWGGMLRHDWLAFTFKSIGLVGLGVTALLSMDAPGLGKKGEYYLLLLTSTIGICLMGASADMIMLFLAIETTSIPLYVLAGFMKTDDRSTEAGFKYLLFGAMTSSVMAYGFSLLFGFTGTTDLYELAQGLASGELTEVGIVFSAMLVLVGFAFKISMVPFHFWAPDVYEGAPTPVAGFLSTASKAAGFAVLIRFALAAFPAEPGLGGLDPIITILLAGACVATMTLGNTIALAQNNIKRLLAYSSIAHAGYVLLGVVAADVFGIASAVFYLLAYLLTNLAAFGVVMIVGRAVGSDEISAYAGLSRRSSGLALVMLVAFLSLAGVPPLAGFIGKIWVFAAVVNQGMYVLAFIGVLNAIIGVYYYLIVLKFVYLYRSDDEDKPIRITRPDALALGLLTFGIILVGTIFAPWWGIADAAAAAIFG